MSTDSKLITIDWDGDTQDSYRGIIMKQNNEKIKDFNTGDLVIDWLNCLIYMSETYDATKDENQMRYSTDYSFDSFFYTKNPKWHNKCMKDNSFDATPADYDYQVVITDKIKTGLELENYYTKKTRSKKLKEIFNI